MEAFMSLIHKQEMTGENFDEMRSPESPAALIAPRDENALLLQRVEDSTLRKLWRLTNNTNKGPSRRADPKNQDDDQNRNVYENK